jgi:hypothetical protein
MGITFMPHIQKVLRRLRLPENLDELLDDHHRPSAVKFVPGMNIIQRWAKVIA